MQKVRTADCRPSLIKNMRTQTTAQKIFNAIQEDNCGIIATLIKEDADVLSYVFGRFPVLSLCYMYQATSIIKKYKDNFYSLTYYKKVFEPDEAYIKFKSVAGVHLRKFPSTAIVTPSEMLALLNEIPYICSNITKLKPSAKARDNIISVCNRRGQKASFTHDKFVASSPPLNKRQRIAIIAVAMFLLINIALVGVALGSVFTAIGFGTESRPFRIYNEEQFRAVANTNSHYILVNDITLSDGFYVSNLTARINGNGHTIYTTGRQSIIRNLSGSFTNARIVVTSNTIHTTMHHSFVIDEITTSGRVENISLHIDASLNVNSASDAVTIGGIVLENRGRVERVTTNGHLEVFSSGSPRINIGGIVGNNTSVGDGTTTRQFGSIIQSDNNLNIATHLIGTDTSTIFLIGGIAAMNNGDVIECGNTARLSFSGSNGYADIGGIVSHSNNGRQINNGHFGMLEVDLSGDANVLIGGIAAWSFQGFFENNFSLGRVVYNIEDDNIIASAGFIAAIRSTVTQQGEGLRFQPHIFSEGNYFLIRDNIEHGIAYIYGSILGSHVSLRLDASHHEQLNINTVEAESEIRDLPIFWER